MAQYFPKIPTRTYVTGNISVGQRHIGLARQRLDILFRSLELSGLPHGFNTLKLSDGTTIKASVSYGMSNIDIYSPPVHLGELLPTIEELSPLYYYRVTHDGIVDLSYSGTVEDFITDRIVVWEIALDDKGNLDTGKGKVVLDVDVEKRIVYPEDEERTDEEIESLLAKGEKYIDQIDSGESPDNMADEWMVSGGMFAPFDSFQQCGGTSVTHAITLYEAYEGYYHMTTPYEFNTGWEEDWCPSYGGVTDHVYTDHEWFLVEESNVFYGDEGYFSYRSWYEPEVDPEYNICRRFDNGAVLAAYICESGTVETDIHRGLKSGTFFTKNNELTDESEPVGKDFPCFFVCEFYMGAGGLRQSAGIGYGTVGGGFAFESYVEFSTRQYHYGGLSDGSSELHTPLEKIMSSEFLLTHTSPLADCEESECHSVYDTFDVYGYGYEDQGLYDYLPCDSSTIMWGASVFPANMIVYNEVYDYYVLPSLFMFAGAKENIVCLSTVVDVGYLKTSWQNADVHSENNAWQCGIQYANAADTPRREGQKIGVVIYIFNPSAYWEIDDETGYESNFWDIHSEREEEDVINSNRVLELEEYINDVLSYYKDIVTEKRFSLHQYFEDEYYNVIYESNYTLNSLEFICTDGILEDKKIRLA